MRPGTDERHAGFGSKVTAKGSHTHTHTQILKTLLSRTANNRHTRNVIPRRPLTIAKFPQLKSTVPLGIFCPLLTVIFSELFKGNQGAVAHECKHCNLM